MRLLLTLCFAILLCNESSYAQKKSNHRQKNNLENGLPKVVAMVHDNIITSKDLLDRIKIYMLMSDPQHKIRDMSKAKKIYGQIKKLMIDEYTKVSILQVFEGADKNAFRTNDLIKDYENRFNLASGQLLKLCKKHDISEDILINHIKADVIWHSYIRSKYKHQFNISELDVERFLELQERLADESHYLIAEIIINKEDRTSDQLQADMENIMGMLRSGQEFSVVANHFSHAPSAINGGVLGFVAQSQLSDNLKAIIEQLRDGGISAPIDLGDAYGIFALIARMDNNPKAKYFGNEYHFGAIALTTAGGYNRNQVESLMMQFNKAIPEIKNEQDFDKLRKNIKKYEQKLGKKINLRKNKLRFSDDGSFMLVNVLESLQPGQKSQPVYVGGNTIMIFCLFSKSHPTKKQVKQLVVQNITNQRVNRIMEKEMRWLRNNIHIKEFN